VLDSYLRWFKLNVVFPGFVDDRVAKILIGVGSIEADAGADLSRRSVCNSRLAISQEAICHPTATANARTVNPRRILAFPLKAIRPT